MSTSDTQKVYLPIRTPNSTPNSTETVLSTTWLPCRIVVMSATPYPNPPGWRCVVALEDGTFRVADMVDLRHELDSDAVTAHEVCSWRAGLARIAAALGPLKGADESVADAAARVIADQDIATALSIRIAQLEAERETLIAEATDLMQKSNEEIARLTHQLADALPRGRQPAPGGAAGGGL